MLKEAKEAIENQYNYAIQRIWIQWPYPFH